jgi:hypothetical protein
MVEEFNRQRHSRFSRLWTQSRLLRTRIAGRSTVLLICAWLALGAIGCTSSPEVNVLSQMLVKQIGGLRPAAAAAPVGALEGTVLAQGAPLAGATVVVAERNGAPHSAITGADGRYRIADVPPGMYAVAAVAAGFDEAQISGLFGLPALQHIDAGQTRSAPPLTLQPHMIAPLPENLAERVVLSPTAVYTATATFPPGAAAQVRAWQFVRDGVTVDSLRVFRPLQVEPRAQPRLLLIVYPSHVDGWQPVSVAFASQGFTVVAISPMLVRGLDIDGSAQDLRVAFDLALRGNLTGGMRSERAPVMGGSFSSALLHRLLRDDAQRVSAVVVVGGIANAFAGIADYNAGKLRIPPQYKYAIPSMGFANVRTLDILRLSPVYTAARLPRTMIIHTSADEVIPIAQAKELEQAAREAGVSVEAYYYDDVSHYLLIGEQMTDAGAEMFGRILAFLDHAGR